MTGKDAAEIRSDEARKEEDLRKRRALVQSSPGLMPYGTPQELAEMVGRLRFMVPGGKKLQDREIWALAQNSFALGLNPLIGECWWISGRGFMPGIKGLRRKGREQLERQDMRLSMSFKPILTKADYDEHRIPLKALAYKCKGFNSLKRHEWVVDAKILREALGPNATHEDILENIGPMPLAVGIGYMTVEEMDNLDNPRWYHVCSNKEMNIHSYYNKMQRELRGSDPCPDCKKKSSAKRNAMPHDQRARKRAEAHMWKQECDLPFNIQSGGHGVGDEDVDFTVEFPDAIEGKFREPSDELPQDDLPEDVVIPEEEPASTPRMERQWEQPILDRLVDLGLANAKKHAVNTLEQSPFTKIPYGELEIVETVAYFIGRALLKKELPKIESQARADLANKAWKEKLNAAWLDKAIEMLNVGEGKDE